MQDLKTCGAVHRVNETYKHDNMDCAYHTCAYQASGCRFSGKLHEVEHHHRFYCAPIHAKIAKLEATIAEDTLIAEKKRVSKTVEKRVSS